MPWLKSGRREISFPSQQRVCLSFWPRTPQEEEGRAFGNERQTKGFDFRARRILILKKIEGSPKGSDDVTFNTRQGGVGLGGFCLFKAGAINKVSNISRRLVTRLSHPCGITLWHSLLFSTRQRKSTEYNENRVPLIWPLTSGGDEAAEGN